MPEQQHQTAGAETVWRAEGRVRIHAQMVHSTTKGWFKPGAGTTEWFKDHKHGPEMVVVPAGEFLMGSPDTESGRYDNEGPQHTVTFAQPF